MVSSEDQIARMNALIEAHSAANPTPEAWARQMAETRETIDRLGLVDRGPITVTYTPAPTADTLMPPADWCRAYGVHVYDEDGWRGEHAADWDAPVTLPEFERRAMLSTVDVANPAWAGVSRDARLCGQDVVLRGVTTPADLKADLGIGEPACGFRLDYPSGEPRFICLEPPHPDRPTLHGGPGYSYDEASQVLRRGSHHEQEI